MDVMDAMDVMDTIAIWEISKLGTPNHYLWTLMDTIYQVMDAYGHKLLGYGRYRHYGHQEKETPRKTSRSTFISLWTLKDTIY